MRDIEAKLVNLLIVHWSYLDRAIFKRSVTY